MRALAFLISITLAAALIAGCGSSTKTQPDGSVFGTMTTGQLPEVKIDGKAMRLAPGARVYNASNLTITPNQVPAESRVRYKTDAMGLVNQVWILPPER
jgi:uncharacterized membrane protein YjjP (DUF1212 family)